MDDVFLQEEQKLLELKTLLKIFDSSSRVGKHRYSGHFYLTRFVEAKYCETGKYEKSDYFDTIEELVAATNLLISENASNG